MPLAPVNSFCALGRTPSSVWRLEAVRRLLSPQKCSEPLDSTWPPPPLRPTTMMRAAAVSVADRQLQRGEEHLPLDHEPA